MKKLIAILMLTLFGMHTAQSQNQVMIVNVDGKVKIKTADKKCIKCEPGAVFNEDATVYSKANSSLMILTENQFIEIRKKGKHKLKDKSRISDKTQLGFDRLFVEFLKSNYNITNNNMDDGSWNVTESKSRGDGWGVENPKSKSGWGVENPKSKSGWGVHVAKSKSGWGVENPKSKSGWGVENPKSKAGWGVENPKSKAGWGVENPKSKGAWGVENPKSKAGWTESDMTIEPAVPGGLYAPTRSEFRWIKHPDVAQYLICIMDEDLNVIFSEISTTGSANIDLSICEPGKGYYWQVFADGKKAISPAITFNIVAPMDLEEINDFGSTSDIYNGTSPAVKGLMKAVAYEYSNMYLETYRTYDMLIKRFPNNNLVRMSYAAFCARMGQSENARTIAEQL